MKVCRKCGKKLTGKNWFSWCMKAHYNICIACLKVVRAKKRLLHKKETNVYNKKWRDKNQNIVGKLKQSMGCAICGYNKYAETLDFHHVNPKDKKFHVVAAYLGRKDFLDEMQKCICLCANCHRHITKIERERERDKQKST